MPNRLAQETSPYLRQHADNPVDWYPWGQEALDRAARENKPILLSIGYSACHWCHVMERESFGDPATAALMNRLFVNVKVDREERPDLDQIYQLAHQMLNNRGGGWPLTVFLTPAQVPMFAGTYFPQAAGGQFGLPAFTDVCNRIATAYSQHRAELRQHSESIQAAFRSAQPAGGARAQFSRAPIDAAVQSLKQGFDARGGGFGQAPKFLHTMELELMLRRAAADEDALHIVRHSLERMAAGGILDQLGGGFARYSVDASWTIPHFEKMLYDNGQMLRLASLAWTVTRSPETARAVEITADWMMREMQAPHHGPNAGPEAGGYYASIDSDSGHEEGKFYLWTREEVKSLLSADEYTVLAPHYGLDAPANFEGRAWHLNVMQDLPGIAARLGRPLEQCAALLASGRTKLASARAARAHPARDQKVLAGWNGLAIAGMACAARVFGRDDWLESAQRAMVFVRSTLWKDGRLLAGAKDGRATLNAWLDDHAFLLSAALELLQAKFDAGLLEFARALGDALLARFEDPQAGAYFYTSHDHEKLFARIKPIPDGDKPSGNGAAMRALVRLTSVTGDTRYALSAERALGCFWPMIEQHPAALASALMALEDVLEPPRTVILRGPAGALPEWQRALAVLPLPRTLVLAVPADAQDLPEVLAKPLNGTGVNAWVCEGVTCLAPVDSIPALRQQLAV